MRQRLGEELSAYLESLEREPVKGLHINTTKCGAQDVDEEVEAERLAAADNLRLVTGGRPAKHPYHAAGLFYMQEPSAMLPVAALDVPQGSRVLDMCAAPGGKSSQLAIKLSGGGLLVSNEIERARAAVLRENIVRMGYRNALITNFRPDRLADIFGGFFDVAVVDAPCSGEGMLRKEPQARADWSEANIRACAARQKEIVKSADKCLKEGGTLLYSTCTFSEEEDEDVSRFILSLGYETVMPSAEVVRGGEAAEFGYRFYPHRVSGEGQYFCLFRKTSAAEREARGGKTYAAASARAVSEIKKVIDVGGLTIAERDGMLFAPAYGRELPCLADGVMLGRLERDGRFTPAHGLFTALADRCVSRVELPLGDERVRRYLEGGEIAADAEGWCAVCVNGYALGGGKGSDGTVKNHYPKGLRVTGGN